MTRGNRRTFPGVNFEPPYDPARDPELRTKRTVRNAALIAGGTVGAPAALYARGLKGETPWRDIPTKIKADFTRYRQSGLASGEVVQDITGTIRKGAIGAAKDVSSVGRGAWANVRGAWRGLVPKKLSARHGRLIELSAKLDDLIQFKVSDDERKKKSHLSKYAALYGVGGVTGAGIATGSLATRNALAWTGRKVGRVYRALRG